MTESIIKRFEQLKTNRGNWESHWREIADRIWPDTREDFFGSNIKDKGGKRMERVFDSTANVALDRFAAALQSMLTPPQQRWHRLMPQDKELARNLEVRKWFDNANDVLFQRRYAPSANYSANQWMSYKSLGAFGSGVLFVDSERGENRYKHNHLGNVYFDENHQGVVDSVYRMIQMTGRQVEQKWDISKLPESARNDIQNKPNDTLEVIHAVFPNGEMQHGKLDFTGMPFVSVYVLVKHQHELSRGGYRTFPYIASRYERAPNEVYGRSPAMQALPDIKMLNEMSKTVIQAAQRAINPPLLLSDDGVLGLSNKSVDLRNGALNAGGIDENGRPKILPLNSGVNIALGEDQMERRRRSINDAFMVSLFQILVETPEMTATEALIRAREKGALMSPSMDRQQSEALGPMIDRELDLAFNARALPPMPDALLEAGGRFQVSYESPLSRMQRSEELIGIQRTIETAVGVAQYDPSILKRFDYNKILTIASEVNGAPAEIMRSEEEVERLLQEEAANQQGQMDINELLQGSQAAKNIAEAQATISEQQRTA